VQGVKNAQHAPVAASLPCQAVLPSTRTQRLVLPALPTADERLMLKTAANLRCSPRAMSLITGGRLRASGLPREAEAHA